jgi:hypothetical protein
MVRIFFSPQRHPGQEIVPLALACGIGEPAHIPLKFAKLCREGPALWQPSDAQNADIAVYTYKYTPSEEPHRFAHLAQDARLPCLFFDTADSPEVWRLPHGLLYRSALYSDRLTPIDRAMPAPCDDLLDYCGGQLPLRDKQPAPTIGFCGYLSPWWKEAARFLFGDPEKKLGHRVRRRALRALRRCPRIHTDFVANPNFFGGALLTDDPAALARIRRRFVDNLLGADYALCVRGGGNFSIRFYEALSAGRIPLLINTRCVLPLAGEIDWNRHCVIVEERDLARAGDLLADFHHALTPEAFRDLQQANRRLWVEYLEPFSFQQRIVDAAVMDKNRACAGLP